MRTDFAQAVTQ
uniref:Uncharacterized protein n=1 Tax=Anguilla anguilla TaxID=7936 RepID=A0A0E9TMY6_ANGAN